MDPGCVGIRVRNILCFLEKDHSGLGGSHIGVGLGVGQVTCPVMVEMMLPGESTTCCMGEILLIDRECNMR